MRDFRPLFNDGGSKGQVHRFEVRTNVPKLRVRNAVENPVSHPCAVWTGCFFACLQGDSTVAI